MQSYSVIASFLQAAIRQIRVMQPPAVRNKFCFFMVLFLRSLQGGACRTARFSGAYILKKSVSVQENLTFRGRSFQ